MKRCSDNLKYGIYENLEKLNAEDLYSLEREVILQAKEPILPHHLSAIHYIPKNPEEELIYQDLFQVITKELSEISKRSKSILERHFLEGQSIKQLKKKECVSTDRIYQLRRKAIKNIRKKLREDYPDLMQFILSTKQR